MAIQDLWIASAAEGPLRNDDTGLRKKSMDKNHSTEGHLMLFDTTSQKTWGEKIFQEIHVVGNYSVKVWGL